MITNLFRSAPKTNNDIETAKPSEIGNAEAQSSKVVDAYVAAKASASWFVSRGVRALSPYITGNKPPSLLPSNNKQIDRAADVPELPRDADNRV